MSFVQTPSMKRQGYPGMHPQLQNLCLHPQWHIKNGRMTTDVPFPSPFFLQTLEHSCGNKRTCGTSTRRLGTSEMFFNHLGDVQASRMGEKKSSISLILAFITLKNNFKRVLEGLYPHPLATLKASKLKNISIVLFLPAV